MLLGSENDAALGQIYTTIAINSPDGNLFGQAWPQPFTDECE